MATGPARDKGRTLAGPRKERRQTYKTRMSDARVSKQPARIAAGSNLRSAKAKKALANSRGEKKAAKLEIRKGRAAKRDAGGGVIGRARMRDQAKSGYKSQAGKRGRAGGIASTIRAKRRG